MKLGAKGGHEESELRTVDIPSSRYASSVALQSRIALQMRQFYVQARSVSCSGLVLWGKVRRRNVEGWREKFQHNDRRGGDRVLA
jgi:hypothetical protein